MDGKMRPEAPPFRPAADLFRPGETVVAAVSGGLDSMALLAWLDDLRSALSLRLAVAHVHHGLRGTEADADAAFVAAEARARGLPFYLVRLTGDAPAANVEAVLRARRYRALAAVARRIRAQAVAVAHTADDQRETLIIKLLRGTSPMGLAGMPAERPLAAGVRLVRPFLFVERAALAAYARARGLSFRHDRSNEDLRFFRNRIRHELYPALRELSPAVGRHLDRLSRLAAEEAAHWDAAVRPVLRSVRWRYGAVIVPVSALASAPPPLQRRAIHLIWKCLLKLRDRPDAALGLEGLDGVLQAIGRGAPAAVELKGPFRAVLDGADLYFLPKDPGPHWTVRPPAAIFWPEARERVSFFLRPAVGPGAAPPAVPAPTAAARFGATAVFRLAAGTPLVYRRRRPGDRLYRPDGRGPKLKDVLAELGVPRPLRRIVPVWAAGRDVLWVPGWVQAEALLPRPGEAAIEARTEAIDAGVWPCPF
ncbi:tRNA lysidine(34) synthetase TilS [Hydrogenibacillus sp. N12]|uniref:tRNA lysidine(34) synthetase TilS n=1 Tax=Hydrogenibacillus sp. N12 TaxID=2866627 RepID=UPI001C7D8680|nr:tRNA lysidine(34) synthetase TilS [Hydrogenibacillus sp. N12]QZA33082.1 tRNA lysidine(34) synthetase TilS [Hydrogenibacillus sp. N12]